MSLDKSEARIRRMFGEIAGRYDLLNHLLSGGTDRYWRWRAVRAVRANGSGPILDVCTGTGDLAVAWWKWCGGRTAVVGSDFTHEMLTRADHKTQRLSRDGTAPIAFLEADTQRLPFGDDQFQIVSAAFGLRNVTDTARGLREMVRVCRPGGHVVILEFSLPSNRLLRGGYQWYFRRVLPRVGQWLARNRQSAYNYLPASVAEFPYGEALAERLRACGLESVRWTPLTFGIATLYHGTKPSLAVSRRDSSLARNGKQSRTLADE
ncbi:MAG: bifunctional demethylmenaquinone methyltransferase/2-methoxy-6-polyprenyl-1,4-benzoquinol methylase UbiE [Planctomycetaceae bacterium]